MSGLLEVRLLGSFEVLLDGQPLAFGSGTERALVAYLALNANRSVSTDSIIDALWGELPPPSAREMVRTYVARARRHLGGALQRGVSGYMLELPPDGIDATRFKRLCEQGITEHDEGDSAAATETLAQALALWRDAPLGELEAFAAVRDQVAWLEEMHLAAIETRSEADLELGSAARLVPELEVLVRANPHRERLRRALMLALYRSGRQTDALDRYVEGRRLLVDEVGIEPSRELQALHQAMLEQDSALDLTARAATIRAPTTVPSPAPAVAGRTTNRRRLGATALTVIAALAAILLIRSFLTPAAPKVGRESVAAIDSADGKVVRVLPITGVPGPIAVGRRTIWVGDGENQAVLALASDRLNTVGIARLGVFPYQLSTDGYTAWAGDGFYGSVTPIDGSGRTSASFRPEPHATGRSALAYGAGALWIGSQDGVLAELDPRTTRAIAVIRRAGDPEALAIGAGSVWVAEAGEDDIRRIDPVTHRVTGSIPIGGAPLAIAIGDGSVWAVTPAESRVWRIDPASNAVTAAIAVAPNPSFVAVTDNAVWVGSTAGTLQRLDPSHNAIAQTIQFDGPISGMAGGSGRLWISVR